jgi:SAM-dependent methyltransferase
MSANVAGRRAVPKPGAHPQDHESVLRSHRWRTAENSAGYLLPYLRPAMDVLDVGCGPGSITVDLARRVAPGRVVGVDLSAEVLVKAGELAAGRGVDSVVFEQADVTALPYRDGSFDVVHAHQVLQHLCDPVAALREMRRVTRPGGIVAVREADYAATSWYPHSPGLDEWARIYGEAAASHGGQAEAGRRLLSWARAAGFDDVTASASVWCFANEAERTWWGTMWAERSVESTVARRAVAGGVATKDDLAAVARAWREWAEADDGWFTVVHGEVLAHR